ncbi:TRAP transporter small permease [uncultured Desulfovibrio sp.]|uniref:TRAP transporter small permease n=1 Tax=uncultured Desulfovibrio sp. TaxID=167968 RepID=UPI00272A6A73|nr:TRAP transporter small permease [uncultured Desulfovibrio sp.]
MLKSRAGLEGCAAVAALVLMFVCIAVQVFFRYALNHALEWPEEVARYAFICAVFLGASLAAQEGRHLEISVCKHSFGPRVQLALTIISTIFTLLFCAVMMVWGVRMVLFVAESEQVAASMNMPMYVLYLAVPLGIACMFLRTVQHALATLRRLRGQNAKDAAQNAMTEMTSSW